MTKGMDKTARNCRCDLCRGVVKPIDLSLHPDFILTDTQRYAKKEFGKYIIVVEPYWDIWFWHKGIQHTTKQYHVIMDLASGIVNDHGILERRIITIYKKRVLLKPKKILELSGKVDDMSRIIKSAETHIENFIE